MSNTVLMFGWEFPPYNSGGLGIACLGLTQSLVREGVQVKFVLPRKVDFSYDYMQFLFADTTTVITREVFEYLQHVINPYSILSSRECHLQELATDMHLGEISGDIYAQVLKYALLSQHIITHEDFDIIHCHDWLTIEAGLLAKRMTGKPLVFHIHATEFDRTGGNVNQVIYDIERKGMHAADNIIAVSNFTKSTMVNHYGIAPEKVEIVHNGIDYYIEKNGAKDTELISNLEKLKALGRKIILFTGRFTMQKGAEYFLQAAKRVCAYDENILFVMAGSGDMEQHLLYLTASLGLSNRVVFPGFVRDEKLKSLYACADLFVMPSVNEPFGLVALEAMVHETPVILSKRAGVTEILRNALTVDFWDVEEMAHLILSVLHHEALHRTLRDFGHDEVKEITWQRAAQKVHHIYRQVPA